MIFSVQQERLEYEIKYGPLVLGWMVLERLAPESLNGEECEHLRAEVVIDEHISWLFWARYRFETWCNVRDMVTRRSDKLVREKNYSAEWSAVFDQKWQVARYSDGAELPLPDSARDLLTLWFYLRTVPWACVETIALNSHIDRRNWRVRFIHSGRQKVRTRAGEFDCLIVSPTTKGPLGTVFIEQNERHLPVVIRTRVGGLTVSAYLCNIKKGL
ncbi:MAG: DUF3108 domain-containing protein [bacterium]